MAIRTSWSKWVVCGVLAAFAVAAVCWWRVEPLAPAVAAPPTPTATAAPTQPAPLPVPPPSAQYSNWVVAYMHGSIAITREMLGEYLIARIGSKHMEKLLNLKIIEHECARLGVTVSAAETQNTLRAELQRLGLTRKEFENRVLKPRGMTLAEYVEDVIRPEQLLTRLCEGKVKVMPEEIRRVYESQFGEKVDCQIIFWPPNKAEEARKVYPEICRNAAAFDSAARGQDLPNLAASAGRIAPFGRYTNENPVVDEAAFRLKPGEVSELIPGKEGGYLVVKCLGRLPATGRKLEEVVAQLEQDVRARKIQEEMKTLFPELRKQANPENRFAKVESLYQVAPEVQLVSAQLPAAGSKAVDGVRPSTDYSERVVGYIYGNVPITREMLGEYLITRVGTQRLDNLMNKLIIEYECRRQGIDVTPVEVEAALQQTMREQQLTPEQFEHRVRTEHRATMYEWKEDVIRPRLLLTKLLHGKVQATEEEIQKAYDAHHGEKVAVQIILWPREEAKRVTMMYNSLRDKPDEFEKQAAMQASAQLASVKGRIEPIGRYSTGNDEMEKVAFALRPGEVSHVMGVPEGLLVMKCLNRVPPTGTPLGQVRDRLEREVIEKKTVLEIPRLAAKLQDTAKPVKILKDAEDTTQTKREVEHEIGELKDKDGKR